jgi:large subunit ribosomal protein L22
MVNYSYEKLDNSKMAKSSGKNLKISFKKSVELSRELKNKKVDLAIKYLEKIIDLKQVVPYRRFKAEMAHKKGAGVDTGGYPVNVAKEFLKLLKSAKKNADNVSLDDENLIVISISARKGTSRYRMGRYSGRSMKSTNVEIIVGECKND